VPPLILQPLVENAVIHGIVLHPHPGTVTLRTAREGDRLVLSVFDSGAGKLGSAPLEDSPERQGVGLRNTRARLAAMYGEQAQLTLSATETGGTCARIVLPLRMIRAS
jgi:sensor histidine kinase YesM